MQWYLLEIGIRSSAGSVRFGTCHAITLLEFLKKSKKSKGFICCQYWEDNSGRYNGIIFIIRFLMIMAILKSPFRCNVCDTENVIFMNSQS